MSRQKTCAHLARAADGSPPVFTPTFAARLLTYIDRLRLGGRPGSNLFFVAAFGPAYVQALAPWDEGRILVEAASAQSQPELWAGLAADAADRLAGLGFQPPDASSPNFHAAFEVRDGAGFLDLGFRLCDALTDVFQVEGEGLLHATFLSVEQVANLRNPAFRQPIEVYDVPISAPARGA